MGVDGVSSWQFAVIDKHYPWHQTDERRDRYDFTVILHQVRDPLAVLASMQVLRRPDWTFIARHLELPKGDLARRITFYLEWMAICDRQAHYCYRVEDLPTEWPQLHQLCGGQAQWTPAAAAIQHTYNHRRHAPLTWEKVLASPRGAEVFAKARLYGYD